MKRVISLDLSEIFRILTPRSTFSDVYFGYMKPRIEEEIRLKASMPLEGKFDRALYGRELRFLRRICDRWVSMIGRDQFEEFAIDLYITGEHLISELQKDGEPEGRENSSK